MTEREFLQQLFLLRCDIEACPMLDPFAAQQRERWAARLGDLLNRRVADGTPAPAPQGWQPIETAPKNLEEVLVYDPDYGGVRVAQYEMHAKTPFWSIDVYDLLFGDNATRERMEIHPTHWMPLPDPPSVAGSGAGSTVRQEPPDA